MENSENNSSKADNSFVSMVANIAKEHGCRVVDIDFETKELNLDGPDEAVAACARALAAVLD